MATDFKGTLFTTTEELQQFLPTTAEFELKALKPYLKLQGIPRLIKKQLGKDLLETLITKYENDNLSDLMEALLEKVRFPLANYAALKFIPFGQIKFSKAGIHIDTGDTRKTAFEWQIEKLEDSCLEAAYNGIEDLLLFLEENKDEAELEDWVTSDAYTVFKECFITTALEFTEIYDIGNSRRTFLALKDSMLEVQQRLKKIISVDFFDELMEQSLDDDLSDANKAIMTFIKRGLANLTIAKAMVKLPVRITGDGVQLMGTVQRETLKGLNPAEKERLSAIIEDTSATGEAYFQELMDYLYEHIDDYDTFKNSDKYVDPASDEAADWDQSDNGIVSM